MSRVYDERPLLTHTHTPRDSFSFRCRIPVVRRYWRRNISLCLVFSHDAV